MLVWGTVAWVYQINAKKSNHYREGQGNLVSRLLMGISRVVIWVTGLLTYLSPSDPPSIGAPSEQSLERPELLAVLVSSLRI